MNGVGKVKESIDKYICLLRIYTKIQKEHASVIHKLVFSLMMFDRKSQYYNVKTVESYIRQQGVKCSKVLIINRIFSSSKFGSMFDF